MTRLTYCVRIPGVCCWADHLRSLSDARACKRAAEAATGLRHWIYAVSSTGIEVVK
jgi:hypothetical protein